MNKKLLIICAIVVAIIVTPFILMHQAFGPADTTRTRDLDNLGRLIGHETYAADFASTTYDVDLYFQTTTGKKYPLGNLTFNHDAWPQNISAKRVHHWIILAIPIENTILIKTLNPTSDQLHDTSLCTENLQHDPLYTARFTDQIDLTSPGHAQLLDFSGDTISIRYTYTILATYPASVSVHQKVVYGIDTATGKLITKEIFDRIAE